MIDTEHRLGRPPTTRHTTPPGGRMSTLDAALQAATDAIVAEWDARHRARISAAPAEHAAAFARQAVIAALAKWIPGAARRELAAAMRRMPAGLATDTQVSNLVGALLAAAFHDVPEAEPLGAGPLPSTGGPFGDLLPAPASQCRCPAGCGHAATPASSGT